MFQSDKARDTLLWEQLKLGNEIVFMKIYDDYWEPLINHTYQRTSDVELAKELVQDLFADLWQKRANLEVHTSIQGYLFQAIRYKVFNHYKATAIRSRHTNYLKVYTDLESNNVEDYIHTEELQEALSRELLKLPPQPQKVYQLKHHQGLTYHQIAENMQISVSTVEKHMIKAMKRLRANLKEFSFSLIFMTLQSFFNFFL